MESLTRATFEVPNWLAGKSAELEVVCQQEKLLLITLKFNDRQEAILYSNTVIHGIEDLERACRLAIRQLEPIKKRTQSKHTNSPQGDSLGDGRPAVRWSFALAGQLKASKNNSLVALWQPSEHL
jgi:hypothetical protein